MNRDRFMIVFYTLLLTLSLVSLTVIVAGAVSDEYQQSNNVVVFEIPDNEPTYPPEYPPIRQPDDPMVPDYPEPRYST